MPAKLHEVAASLATEPLLFQFYDSSRFWSLDPQCLADCDDECSNKANRHQEHDGRGWRAIDEKREINSEERSEDSDDDSDCQHGAELACEQKGDRSGRD